MKKFEAEEKQRQADEEARHNQMDADGFVMVSRKRGRSTATEASTGATVGVVSKYHEEHESASSKKEKKKNKGELVDFYHFQQVLRRRSIPRPALAHPARRCRAHPRRVARSTRRSASSWQSSASSSRRTRRSSPE